MTEPSPVDATELDASAVALVRRGLTDALDRHRASLGTIAPEAEALLPVLEQYLEGGKLLRPRLAVWGGIAALGAAPSREDLERLAGIGAAIELVQAAALMHDDVIDHSPTRRGRPAVHVAAARHHAERGGAGSSEDFGTAIAIILGDLALSWSEQLCAQHLPEAAGPRERARTEFDALRTEVMTGQYLDVLHQAGGFTSPDSPAEAALAVIRWKTVPYTVLRPLRTGAAAMGADDTLLEGLSAWAVSVGTAFQLRDDLLSISGDPDTTGKPIGGDIIEGKRTLLLEIARERADAAQLGDLEAAVGRSEASAAQIDAAHQVLRRTGAVAEVAARITQLGEDAEALLARMEYLRGPAREQLARIGRSAMTLEGLDLT